MKEIYFLSTEKDTAGTLAGVRKLRSLQRRAARKSIRGMVLVAFTAGAFAMLNGNIPLGLPVYAIARAVRQPDRQPGGHVNTPKPSEPPGKIWIVEQHDAYSVYSNGLQIRADFLTSSKLRSYRTFARGTLQPSTVTSRPAGIVYHTTESALLPMEAEKNRVLLRTREDLLNLVRRERLYNFVIDRFGQVFRIVPEDQVAFHAGHSIWADDDAVYEGLNDSFIGVSFEARTETDFEATPAQIRSGRMLTEMLRAVYSIPEADCVTHAQVSVNPDNMRIGYHTDWAARFPFREFGFDKGYGDTVASIEVFGFGYDQNFLEAIGGRPWGGLVAAEASIDREAAKQGISVAAYRRVLQQRYRVIRRRPSRETI